MAIIKIKTGTTTPTTSHLTEIGEIALNTITNEVFIRSTSSVVKIGGGWQLLYTGSSTIPSSISTNNITLNQSVNIYGKILAFEVRNATGTDSYETQIVLGRIGSNTTTSASSTYDRLFSWSVFDGTYFKVHSFKAYGSNAVTNQMTVGYVKHLVGSFSGTVINWTTNTTTSIYLERIWMVN